MNNQRKTCRLIIRTITAYIQYLAEIKKKKLKKRDFDTTMHRSGIPKKSVENLRGRIKKGSEKWSELLSKGFLNKEKSEELLILKKEQNK